MTIHIEIDIDGEPKTINEVSQIITRAMHVPGVKRFAISSDPPINSLDTPTH